MKVKLVGIRMGTVKKQESKYFGKPYAFLQLLVEGVVDDGVVGNCVKEEMVLGDKVTSIDSTYVGKYVKLVYDRNILTGREEFIGIELSEKVA